METTTPTVNKNKFKMKDFIHLIVSVNPKKGLFLLGMLFSLITSAASLVVPQLTKTLVDASGTPTFSTSMLVVLILAFVLQLGVGTLGGFLLRYVGESAVKTLRNVFGNICCICQSAILMTTSRGKAVRDSSMILP